MNKEIEYRGLYFNEATEKRVMDIIADNLHSENRLRFFYGDSEKYWLDEYQMMGTIGKSTGTQPIPLLITSKRSIGGGGILTHCIQMITIDKTVIYKNPNFIIKDFEIKEATPELKEKELLSSVYYEGVNVANFETQEKAERWIKFMTGKSNRK